MYTSNCIICGEVINSISYNIKFCSQRCKYINYRRKYEEKRKIQGFTDIENECQYCGKKYITNNKKMKYCSLECGRKSRINRSNIRNKIVRKQGKIKMRFEILKRDNFKCHYCGRTPSIDNTVILVVDHINPKKNNGSNDIENLITSCYECNSGKSDVLLNNLCQETTTKAIKIQQSKIFPIL